jgi:hypothetical protein
MTGGDYFGKIIVLSATSPSTNCASDTTNKSQRTNLRRNVADTLKWLNVSDHTPHWLDIANKADSADRLGDRTTWQLTDSIGTLSLS